MGAVRTDVIGKIIRPGAPDSPIKYKGLSQGGFTDFLSNIISLIILIAGIFTLVNFVLAGYGYLSSSNDPQKIAAAGNKILESLIGLIIVAAAFIIAGLIGFVVFGDQSALINLNLFKVTP